MSKLNEPFESKSKFAARVGVTKGRISQLVAAGLPVREDGSIDIEAALAWMEANLDPAKRNKGGTKREALITGGAKDGAGTSSGMPSLGEARRLHLIVQIERAKIALQQERGQLIDAEQASATVFNRARAERDAHIAWVQRSAPIIAGELCSDPAKTFAVLDRLMREHLDCLADTPLDVLQHVADN